MESTYFIQANRYATKDMPVAMQAQQQGQVVPQEDRTQWNSTQESTDHVGSKIGGSG